MTCLWNRVRNIVAVIAVLMIMGAAGTSDGCLMMNQPEPAWVNVSLVIAVIMLIPTVIHLFCGDR